MHRKPQVRVVVFFKEISVGFLQEPRFLGRAGLHGSCACNFPVAAGSGAAVTCERCVLREVTGRGDHSPHPRLVWDLLMGPVASEQFSHVRFQLETADLSSGP